MLFATGCVREQQTFRYSTDQYLDGSETTINPPIGDYIVAELVEIKGVDNIILNKGLYKVDEKATIVLPKGGEIVHGDIDKYVIEHGDYQAHFLNLSQSIDLELLKKTLANEKLVNYAKEVLGQTPKDEMGSIAETPFYFGKDSHRYYIPGKIIVGPFIIFKQDYCGWTPKLIIPKSYDTVIYTKLGENYEPIIGLPRYGTAIFSTIEEAYKYAELLANDSKEIIGQDSSQSTLIELIDK